MLKKPIIYCPILVLIFHLGSKILLPDQNLLFVSIYVVLTMLVIALALSTTEKNLKKPFIFYCCLANVAICYPLLSNISNIFPELRTSMENTTHELFVVGGVKSITDSEYEKLYKEWKQKKKSAEYYNESVEQKAVKVVRKRHTGGDWYDAYYLDAHSKKLYKKDLPKKPTRTKLRWLRMVIGYAYLLFSAVLFVFPFLSIPKFFLNDQFDKGVTDNALNPTKIINYTIILSFLNCLVIWWYLPQFHTIKGFIK